LSHCPMVFLLVRASKKPGQTMTPPLSRYSLCYPRFLIQKTRYSCYSGRSSDLAHFERLPVWPLSDSNSGTLFETCTGLTAAGTVPDLHRSSLFVLALAKNRQAKQR
jgi:hypothetical protein